MWVMVLPSTWVIQARWGTREACVIVSIQVLSPSTHQSRWSVYHTGNSCEETAHRTIHSTHSVAQSSSEMRLSKTSICSTLSSVIMMAKSTSKIASYTARIWTNASWITPRTSARVSSLQVSSALNNQVPMPINTYQSNTELMLFVRLCELKRTLQPRRTRYLSQQAVCNGAAICEQSLHSQILPVR